MKACPIFGGTRLGDPAVSGAGELPGRWLQPGEGQGYAENRPAWVELGGASRQPWKAPGLSQRVCARLWDGESHWAREWSRGHLVTSPCHL